jgi:hypothetical protein
VRQIDPDDGHARSLRSTPGGVNNGGVRAALLLVASAALACGTTGLVVPLEHRPVTREDPLPEGVARLVYAVTLDDERGEDDVNYLCRLDRDVLSERPVPQVVREAVETELRVRDLRVAAPEDADVVIHIELHDFTCKLGRKSGASGIDARVEAELGLRLNPGAREVYWTTLNQHAFRVPSPSQKGIEPVVRRALDAALDAFAQHVATHPDLMIQIQDLQARGELPQ